MIDFFRSWISSILCVGIFTAIVEMILPKGSIKKYIHVLIGVITLIVIISPFMAKEKYEQLEKEAVSTISKGIIESEVKNQNNSNIEKYSEYKESMVKNEYANNIKKSIWNDLTSKGVMLDSINILLSDDYSVSKIDIYVKKYAENDYKNKEDIIQYIKKYYEIDERFLNIIRLNEVDVYGKE